MKRGAGSSLDSLTYRNGILTWFVEVFDIVQSKEKE
jgi:hypothetical protein